VRAGTLYSGEGSMFTRCRVTDCAAGPQPIDLPFEPGYFRVGVGPTALVATFAGAYAIGGYVPPPGSAGLGLGRSLALVYIPPAP
jgi:hypothetical protein